MERLPPPILGFNQGTTKFSSTLERDIRYAEQSGYDAIEIRIDKLNQYIKERSIVDLVESLSRARIEPHFLNAIKDFNTSTMRRGTSAWELFERSVHVAAELGAPGIVLVPTQLNQDDPVSVAAEAIERMLAVAEPAGVKLAVEPVGLRGYSIHNLNQAQQIVAALGHPLVGIAIDTFNLWQTFAKEQERWRDLRNEHIFTVHMADCDGHPRDTLTQEERVWPGRGTIPICDMYDHIRRTGYVGPYCLELFNPAYYQMAPEDVHSIGFMALRSSLYRCD